MIHCRECLRKTFIPVRGRNLRQALATPPARNGSSDVIDHSIPHNMSLHIGAPL